MRCAEANWSGALAFCGTVGPPAAADTANFDGAANIYFSAPITIARLLGFAGLSMYGTNPSASLTINGNIEELSGAINFTLDGYVQCSAPLQLRALSLARSPARSFAFH